MKNLTTTRLMQSARSAFIIICLFTLGIGQLSGATWSFSGTSYMYFYNKAGWTDSGKMLFIGKSSYSSVYTMSAVSNTKLWVVQMPSSGWSDATYMAVAGASSVWGAGSWGPTNRTNATHYTNTYTSGLSTSSTQFYTFTPASTSNNANISLNYEGSGYSSMNKSITVAAKVSTNAGSSYSASSAHGQLKISSKKFSAYNTCGTSSSVTVADGTASGSASCGYTATTTLTAGDKTGYDFVGWYNSSGVQQTTSKTLTIYPTAAATYYAYYVQTYEVKVATITVGGSATPTSWTYMSPISGGDITATPSDGYSFSSWSILSGGAGYFGTTGTATTSTTANTKFRPTKSTSLKATFTANTYNITLDGNGGSDGSATVVYNTMALASISPATRAGYSLTGYWTASSGGNKVINTDGSLNNVSGWVSGSYWIKASDCTLHAQWEVDETYYDVTYGVGTGYTSYGSISARNTSSSSDVSSGDDVLSGSSVTFTASPNTGYEVVGFYSDAACTSSLQSGSSTTYTTTVEDNTTVYVKFQLSTYAITYGNMAGATNHSDNPTSYTYNTPTITLLSPTKAGYYFAGWYTDDGVWASQVTTIANHSTGDKTLYAKWIGFSGVTVKPSTLHTGSKTDTIVVGDAITITPTLVNAPATHKVCATLYRKDEGQWVEQDVTISGEDTKTIAAKPLDSKPLPAGEYRITLSLRDGSTCEASEIIQAEKVFKIGEQGWYIYGSNFYGWDDPKADIPASRLFKPTSTAGLYYFGPWKFNADVQYFRIYSKIESKDYFTSPSSSDYTITAAMDGSTDGKKITLVSGSFTKCFYCSLNDKDYYLYIQDGKMWISSTRPTIAPKVRFYVSSDGGTTKYYSGEISLADGKARKTSFYHPGGTVTFTAENHTLGVGWAATTFTYDNQTAITTAITAANKGVYVADLTWTSSDDHVAISNVTPYTGNYYIRTDHSPGGWDNYTTSGNQFTYSDYTSENEGYTHYFMKWVEGANDAGRNVKFDVANDYSFSLSKNQDGYGEDTYANGYGQLKQNANVRFMYDERTNTLSRAYLSGSSVQSDYFLVLKGDHTAGYHLYTKEDKSAEHTTNGTTDWAFFSDILNWVYQVDVFATPGTRIKLTAQFKNKSNVNATQYFKGSDGAFDEEHTEPLIGGSGSRAYKMHVVYDFKTNRLISAWEPDGDITDVISDVDVMLERYKDEAATAITFNGGSLTAKNIIGAIRFAYNDLHGQVSEWNNTTRPLLKYFISFPFDVNVSDLFGLNSAYGDAYIIQRYAGDERAAKGFFRGDGTTTFWRDMSPSEKMEKDVGYCLILDNDYFNGDVGHIWDDKTSGTSVYLYFPSTGDVGSISGEAETIAVPEQTCTINRTYTNKSDKTLSHTVTDSHWNLMGVPVFGNTLGSTAGTPGAVFLAEEDDERPFRYYYGWNADNSFSIANAATTTFKSMHCYMVQYHGDVTFTGTSPVASVAARRLPLNKNYTIELQALGSEREMINRTYIELREEACDTFALNEDVYMEPNKRAINIYTYAGNYDVGANVLSVGDHLVPVGLEVRKTGTYVLSMAGEFSGSVYLIDQETGERTNLALDDVTIDLGKGTYDERFVLDIHVDDEIVTDVEYSAGEGSMKDGKPHKFLKNGIMYLLRDGVVYDARGQRVE